MSRKPCTFGVARAAKPVRGVQPEQPVALNLHPRVAPLRHNVHLAAGSGHVRSGAMCLLRSCRIVVHSTLVLSLIMSWPAMEALPAVCHRLRGSMSRDASSKCLSRFAADSCRCKLGH